MSATTDQPHVAVLAFPFATHAAPLLAVIRHLAAAAPNTSFSFFNTPKSNNSIFNKDMLMLPNLKRYDVWDGVPKGYVFTGKHQEEIELFMEAAPESFGKGMEVAMAENGREVTCLVTDAFFWFAAEMAEQTGVAWVPFWTAGPTSLSAHIYTDFIRKTIGIGGNIRQEDETLKFISGMSKARVKDLPEGVLFGNLESIFSRMLHQMGLNLSRATAVFINSFEELDHTITTDLKSKLRTFFNIGPFNLISSPPKLPDTSGCISWLDKQNAASVAYISFGSVTQPSPSELIAVAEALEASKVPFIWSVRDTARVHLPTEFLNKTQGHGIVVSWAPQQEILAHCAVGVFLTHCGWNSVLESIVGGVPMICRPFFGDQRLNGRMVEDVWEIGVRVEGGVFTKNAFIASLDQILSEEKGKKMRENVKGLKEAAERAVGPKGSSIKNLLGLQDLVSRPKVSLTC
ncbi:UDP-glucose: flavonoid 3-O-glucosyltransferase [Tripterygium wilfordii]|uniref:Glycosyltransferase n=1 Tax=Tripterygium wilfordii TaxID=458696 RepID=A0A7J7DSQ4_TRIWF|nr:anthocyanidin 3-O-glucosyltransferase UFGT-like [Tripterygium wilfordii]KAF5749341.1 UDP-glucose: flavonoid 3-O-glucosyltransferase [Tripterygium wilfordii]